MPDLKTHVKSCKQNLGRGCEEVHRWMDEPSKGLGRAHRIYRHNIRQTPALVEEIWSEKFRKGLSDIPSELAREACIDHILLDMNAGDLGEQIMIPERRELKHAIIPFTPKGLDKDPSLLSKTTCWDVNPKVGWLEPDAYVVAYYKQKLIGEAKVVKIVRGIKDLRTKIKNQLGFDIHEFLFYPTSLAHEEVYDTLIFIENFRFYDPPVRWSEVRKRIFGSEKSWYPQRPLVISARDLEYIRGY